MLKKIFLLTGLFFTNFITASEITAEMHANAEKAIAACEASYRNTKKQRLRFDAIKKPSAFSSSKKKKAYKYLEVNKRVFDVHFAEFTKFTNEKIALRAAKTPKKLRDGVIAYSSNCSRFAAGVAGFVEWAITGNDPAGFAKLYKLWQEETR